MAAKPALLLSPDGSFDANGRVSPTITGGVLTVPGQYGNAWQIAEATTNLIVNPSVETNVSSLSGTNIGQTITKDNTRAKFGLSSAKVTADGTQASSGLMLTTESGLGTVGQTYTISGWLWVPVGRTSALQFRAEYTDGSNDYLGSLTTIKGSNDWQYITSTATTTAGLTLERIRPRITIQTNGQPIEFWADGFQVEEKPYATPFAHGDMGTGYSWTGTPHNSASTRAVGRVYYDFPDLPVDTGSVLIRWNAEKVDQQHGQYIGGLGVIGGGTERVLTAYITEPGDQFVRTRPTHHNHGPLQPTSKPVRTVYMEYTPTTTASDFLEGGGRIERGREFNDLWTSNRVSAGWSGNAGTPVPLNGTIEGVLVFDDVLTEAEIAEYTSMGAWGWGNTFGPHSEKIFPSYQSGVFAMSAAVYKTDQLNESREDISQFITSLTLDGDAGRTTSKLQCKISAVKEVVADSDWVAPYLTYTPETGDPVTQQMGHYRLDIPSTMYDDTAAEYTEATGTDILELLSTMLLPATFYTTRGADVMQDIRALISMATRGWVGPNLVNNASFEGENNGNLTVWNNNGTFSAGGSGTIQFVMPAGYDYPSGERAWGPAFSPMQPAGATATVYQTIGIPAHMVRQEAWLSGMFFPVTRDHRGYLKVDFYDIGDQVIPGKSWQTTPEIRRQYVWSREFAYGTVPENAVTARITVAVVDAVGGSSGARRSSWDDITFQAMMGTPIPENRISLPAIEARAETRIQSVAGTSFLTAIDTRLEAAGMYALMPTLDGHLTARPEAPETPVVTYTENDTRIIDSIQIDRDAGNRFNAVLAVKENLQNGVFWSAIAVNNNPKDPWNVYGPLGQITERIAVQDAVSIAALYTAARTKLKEASIQEVLTMAVLPDTSLMLHDDIMLETNNRADGLWTIRALSWGTSDEDPLVKVSAKRTIEGGEES